MQVVCGRHNFSGVWAVDLGAKWLHSACKGIALGDSSALLWMHTATSPAQDPHTALCIWGNTGDDGAPTTFVNCLLQKPLAKQLTKSTHRDVNTWQVHQQTARELQAHLCACGTLGSNGKRNFQVERETYMVQTLVPLVFLVLCLSCAERCMPPNCQWREQVCQRHWWRWWAKCYCSRKAVTCLGRVSLIACLQTPHTFKSTTNSIKVHQSISLLSYRETLPSHLSAGLLWLIWLGT